MQRYLIAVSPALFVPPAGVALALVQHRSRGQR